MGNYNSKDIKEDGVGAPFQLLHGNKELMAKVIESFPYSIQVYATDGTSVLLNKAMLEEYGAVNPDMVVGKYNIFRDPDIIASGQINELNRAFRGEIVFFADVKVPLEGIAERYGIKDLDIEALYQDITLFPIFDDEQRVAYVAALLINRRVYRGKEEIEKAKEYLETGWKEEFDLGKTAKAAGLSKAHFTRLFKKHTGMTPHEYYIDIKIHKVREKLLDANLSVAQAFAACNMNYNGHLARIFKEKTGVSPSAYRKMLDKQAHAD